MTFAKDLRINASDAENKLWHYLRSKSLLNLKFRRQAVIGRYIVDFVCHEKKLVIELDGGQHYAQEEYDKKRSRWLEGEGYKVIRFDNNEFLKNVDGVLEIIVQCLMGR
ncbi:MAG: endonuclease domain-containing protein [Deltaproteobacteria bacterium]|nr:endonuclease domain-containing protein [Deltaproteobacteria bacterium]